MFFFKNHLISRLYSISSKFLVLDERHMCKKQTCAKSCLIIFESFKNIFCNFAYKLKC